ncbi:hypothetical protein Cni_G12771 [Canna indica]|uniref:G-patch domain-containing protein n=1 Tax=Canna indica TaxID=4628 RepID=A0AAQ3QD40_9LILI|nr:hypothetical protein Cni_G12771 [Canna indica]
MATPEAPTCYAGVARQSAAFRLMKQMVLVQLPLCSFSSSREGLGKEKQGIKGHIRVTNKKDTTGVGLDKASNNWAFDTSQFDKAVEKDNVEVESRNDTSNIDPVVKATRPQGRYKKRERGKIVNAYSAKDLHGILVSKGEDNGQVDLDVDDEPESLVDSTIHQEVSSVVKVLSEKFVAEDF